MFYGKNTKWGEGERALRSFEHGRVAYRSQNVPRDGLTHRVQLIKLGIYSTISSPSMLCFLTEDYIMELLYKWITIYKNNFNVNDLASQLYYAT